MASETELRQFIVSRYATKALRGRRRLALIFLELLRTTARRFGTSTQVLVPTRTPHAHGPDALSLASVDAGVEPWSARTRTIGLACRMTVPKRRSSSNLNLKFSVMVEPSTARAG